MFLDVWSTIIGDRAGLGTIFSGKYPVNWPYFEEPNLHAVHRKTCLQETLILVRLLEKRQFAMFENIEYCQDNDLILWFLEYITVI